MKGALFTKSRTRVIGHQQSSELYVSPRPPSVSTTQKTCLCDPSGMYYTVNTYLVKETVDYHTALPPTFPPLAIVEVPHPTPTPTPFHTEISVANVTRSTSHLLLWIDVVHYVIPPSIVKLFFPFQIREWQMGLIVLGVLGREFVG